MKVWGQLERAAVENLSSDPTPGIKGRLWFNTSSGLFKYDDGTSVQIVGALSASADSIAAAMTTTGTGSIVATMTAANAGTVATKISTTDNNTLFNRLTAPNATVSNLIRGATTKVTATSAAALGQVLLTTTCGSYSTNTGGLNVTNMTGTIVTSGKPIVIKLVPDGTNGAASVTIAKASSIAQGGLGCRRGDIVTGVDMNNLELIFGSTGPTTVTMTVPPSGFEWYDQQVAGTYQYNILTSITGAATITVKNCCLKVYEEV